ncbi:DUF859 family phage minor structural protein [Romboutsia sp.]|uniref:DUF859 family phage minor structural protein n=1 Tax=Romboutsia sp. TaxID=1965302 RepID=UPI003F2ED143
MSLNRLITTRATDGTISNTFRTGYKVQISWSVNSQNVANNTSNVTVHAQLVSASSSYNINSSTEKKGSLTINGSTYNFTFNATLSGGQTKTVYTKTLDIPHNSDGTKTFAMSTTLGINITLSGIYWGDVTANGNGTLNSMPRTSTISLSTTSIEAGNTITVNINRASNELTHQVFYSFGSKRVTISNDAPTSAQYTIPLDHITVIPNNTSGTATISVDTYAGSTYIGSTSQNFTINVPESVKPSFSSITASVVADGASTSYGYVKGKSKCGLAINGASGNLGSSISSYSISGGDFSSSAQSFTTGKLTNAGNINFTAYVMDSRGRRSDSKTVSISVLDYMNPNLIEYSVFRCTSNGIANEDGTYIKVSAKYTFTKLSGENNATNLIEFKTVTSEIWNNAGALTVTTNDNGDVRTVAGSIVTGSNSIVKDQAFDIRITLKDKFSDENGISKTILIPTSFVTMDIKRGGKGIAFGKSSEKDMLFEVGMDAAIKGQINTYAVNFDGFKNWDSGNFNLTGEGAYIVNDNGNYKSLMILGNKSSGGTRKVRIFDDAIVSGNLDVCGNVINQGYLQLPSNGGSWINGSSNGAIRCSKLSTGSYHPIISQTTANNHKISLGGIGDQFGFHHYYANRTDDGIDKYFRFDCGNGRLYTNFSLQTEDSVRINGTNPLYFEAYGGGWNMTDDTWIRAYNDKNIYSSNTIKGGTGEYRWLKPEGSNDLNINVNGGSLCISVAASSGAGLYINRNWSGSSGTEPSFYNTKGNGWGFIGNSGTPFYRVYGSGGSVSDRNKKYEITKADTQAQYENIKDINIYNYRSISTVERTLEELAADYLKDRIEFYSNEQERILGIESVTIDDVVYEKLNEDLDQEEIHALRADEIIKKNKNLGECHREDLSLGCMVDEMPLETTFYDNEGGDGKAVDMYSYTTMIAGATKHIINKVETLERENEELRTRLNKMEEILNGITNRG